MRGLMIGLIFEPEIDPLFNHHHHIIGLTMGKCFSKPSVSDSRRTRTGEELYLDWHDVCSDYEPVGDHEVWSLRTQGIVNNHKHADQRSPISKGQTSPERRSLGSNGVDNGSRETSTGEERGSNASERSAVLFSALEQVKNALLLKGFNLPNLIVGIDFTRNNLDGGSFNSQSLHYIGDFLNPYEQAISIIWETLALFTNTKSLSCYGFGDESTHDKDVFAFYPGEMVCQGIEEVLERYREIVHLVKFSGPTSLVPIIEMAMTMAQKTFEYHVLLIVANGGKQQMTEGDALQEQEKAIEVIRQARNCPLFIILVGVGDDTFSMKALCDKIPASSSDHFQFVNFTEIMSKEEYTCSKEEEFTRAALNKIPSHYKAATRLNPFSCGRIRERVPLPPPVPLNSTELSQSLSSSLPDDNSDEICTLCFENNNEVIFGCCGQQACNQCAECLAEKCQPCPFCRSPFRG